MRSRWSVIRLVLVLVLVGLLYGFTHTKNKGRKLTGMEVHFTDENSPFITLSSVNKLLIQNDDSITSIAKETLDLKEMESRLLQNPMVRDAQVFVTADGKLGANIEQRNPIARVVDNPSYYVDEEGKKMPLSKVYAARVPIITGSSETHFTELTPLLLKIRDDEFMNKIVVGVHLSRNGSIDLEMRKMDFNVRLGKIKEIGRKFQNFKAFYQKAKRDNKLTSYRLVDLQFGSQVVATKK